MTLLTVAEYRCHKCLRSCSFCRNHSPVFLIHDLWQVGNFLLELRFYPQKKLIVTIFNWNIIEINIKKIKDWATRTSIKTGSLFVLGRVKSFCSTSDTRRLIIVTNTVTGH